MAWQHIASNKNGVASNAKKKLSFALLTDSKAGRLVAELSPLTNWGPRPGLSGNRMAECYKKILVFQDAFSESTSAISCAAALRGNDGEITVLDVEPPLSALWDELFAGGFRESPRHDRRHRLDTLVRAAPTAVENISTKVVSGRPAVQLIKEVAAGGYDLVIKESQGTTRGFFFGGLDMRLVRHCPVPVLLTHPEIVPVWKKILVAMDPEVDETEMDLNSRLVFNAAIVRNCHDSRLYLLGAWQSPSFAFQYHEEHLKRYEQIEKQVRYQAADNLKSVLDKSSVKLKKPEDLILENGEPDDVILATIEKLKPDLLVIGSVARGGLSGLMLGNTAERVLNGLSCSVLIVKPSGFASPIAERLRV